LHDLEGTSLPDQDLTHFRPEPIITSTPVRSAPSQPGSDPGRSTLHKPILQLCLPLMPIFSGRSPLAILTFPFSDPATPYPSLPLRSRPARCTGDRVTSGAQGNCRLHEVGKIRQD
jgi:hypothetical protein